MSAQEGSKEFKKKLNAALAKSNTYKALVKNYRQKLNTENMHILDISKEVLSINATTDEQKIRFPDSYKLFIETIENKAKPITYKDLNALGEANPDKLTGSQVIYIQSPALLICASFKAARDFVTNKISRAIPSDEFFGITNRSRSIDELRSEGYEVFPVNPEAHQNDPDNYKDGWRVRSTRTGKLRAAYRYFDNNGLELDSKDVTKLYVRELSNLDIGHLYTKSPKDAPLGFKLNRVLNVRSLSDTTRRVVEEAIESLVNFETSIDFSYENLLPKKLKQAGTLVLRLEFYKLNGQKALIETAIYNKVKEEIINEVKKDLAIIPGSNTMLEDFSELLKQGFIAELSGKPNNSKVPLHDLVTGNINTKQNTKKVKTTTQTLKLGSTPPAGSLNSAPSTTNLIKLQNLINAHLQDVVSANMGSGGQRSVLNYRTGRFASSAKVEKLSQSREGMITAFYSYMKNPYQTFEPGFRQGSPKTRDPKLLIAKSIREIAETSVANRMRAVSV